MIYLILAILSSTFVAVTMRLSEKYRDNSVSTLAVNYVLCLAFSIIQMGGLSISSDLPSIGLGIIQGILYLSGFILLQYNITKNGIVLSSTFMKLGVLVPTLAAVFLFGEIPTITQGIGFVIAIASILLINLEKGAGKASFMLGLIILLIVGGTTDVMAKLYEQLGSTAYKDQFIFFTFLAALLLCAAIAVCKKESLSKKDIACGVMIGVPNYFSAIFLLNSLLHVPAIIVYPTYSVSTIICVTLSGILFFKEKLSRQQIFAIVLILIALVLLNL